MTEVYNILRALTVSALAIAIVVPLMLYIVLSLDFVQNRIKSEAEKELSELIGADIHIGNVNISPFNKLTLNDVSVVVAPSDTVMTVDRLGAGVVLWKLLLNQKLVISYAEVFHPTVNLWRESAGAPLNIQTIIDKLSSKDKNKPPTIYDLRINNIVVRRGEFNYDILDAPKVACGFDKNHIHVSNLKADVLLPRIKNDYYEAQLKRLEFKEASGISVDALSFVATVSDKNITLKDFVLRMPESKVYLADMSVDYNGFEQLSGKELYSIPLKVSLLDGTVISSNDIAPFLPKLNGIDERVYLTCNLEGTISDMAVNSVSINNRDNSLALFVKGRVTGLPEVNSASADIETVNLHADASRVARLLTNIHLYPSNTKLDMSKLGVVTLNGAAHASTSDVAFDGTLVTALGAIDMDADYKTKNNVGNIDGNVKVKDLNVGTLIGNADLGLLSATVDGSVVLKNKRLTGGNVALEVENIECKGYEYNDISGNLQTDGNTLQCDVAINDPNVILQASGDLNMSKEYKSIMVTAHLEDFNPHMLNLTDKYEGYAMGADASVNLRGDDYDSLDGRVDINHFRFTNGEKGVSLNHFTVQASNSTTPQYVLFNSDICNAQLTGSYSFAGMVPVVNEVLGSVFPVFFTQKGSVKPSQREQNFDFDLTIKHNDETDEWLKFFNSPVRILHPVDLKCSVNENDGGKIKVDLAAPYLLQKDKFIDNTRLTLDVNGEDSCAIMQFATLYPTKNGNASINFASRAKDNNADAELSWRIDRQRNFSGKVDVSAQLGRDVIGDISALIGLKRSEIVLNDTVWTVHDALIDYKKDRIEVNNVDISCANQYIKIDGVVSDNPDDELTVQLSRMNLDYIFETLDIGNAMFGGIATGNFYASGLLSKEPRLLTPGLHVDRIKYNFAMLGDADIVSEWDNETKGVNISAVISQPNEKKSYIEGVIYPLSESLDFRFKADDIDVKFMKPYMEAFTSDVSGYASGDAHLYGTFKYIDMTGEIYARDLKIKLDFTNTYYTTSDSVHITPGRIEFSKVKLHDMFGNSAQLDGWVSHKFFKEPEFEFDVTDARNFLCYDVTEKLSPDWYGRIFCNGTAIVKGVPGFIDMSVNISTAPQSIFTFVLSDTEAASEYTFMTFRDRDEVNGDLLLSVQDPNSAAIKKLKDYYAQLKKEESNPSIYRINLQVEATPQAEMVLVMDPAGGDKIKARGNGNLRMEYNSADEELKMFGTYTLTQGSYNFTLQDIIIKDFTIKSGSSIAFHGDPLAATLDIEAVYAVNANLSDLDESFLQDRELNRTNVPVHALLQVSGDMQQPDINFDLEFPTLTQDTYRKVKSIVSTEEMMNRQIIYLLALNRFYTPDYMASTTKGNELVSVASSTISSQLSSMLGQLSDHWSIAPNIRSDKGDFSDMEVDLALSSYLLNNRLLFNGNFGYRDKALNNNSFIGDFDLEYLLNKSGNIRLKAYNRYNDQNFYVKTALTTQGVGVVFKRDFDSWFSFLRRSKKKNNEATETSKEASDSVAVKVNVSVENGNKSE